MNLRVATTLLPLLITALVGCGDRPRPIPPEVREQQEGAYRQACIARELAAGADEDVDVLVAATESPGPDDPVGDVIRQTNLAALDFARAFQRHAELRASSYAHLDSAVNHAATPADSTRYLERAAAFSIRTPAEGTVEANVLTNYQNRLAETMEDEDHPCNWDIPF